MLTLPSGQLSWVSSILHQRRETLPWVCLKKKQHGRADTTRCMLLGYTGIACIYSTPLSIRYTRERTKTRCIPRPDLLGSAPSIYRGKRARGRLLSTRVNQLANDTLLCSQRRPAYSLFKCACFIVSISTHPRRRSLQARQGQTDVIGLNERTSEGYSKASKQAEGSESRKTDAIIPYIFVCLSLDNYSFSA